MVGVIIASALIGIHQSNKASKAMARAQGQSAQLTREQLEFQKEQAAALEKQKDIYRRFEFKNPYANLTNPYENMQNMWANLRVNTDAAEFQMEQGAQQRANILDSLRNVAGSSGVSGLAQTLANQGILQARQVSTDLAQQQRQNEMARIQGDMQVQQAKIQGQSAVDMAMRSGESMVQEMEAQRQSTLLGVAYQGLAGANAGVQQAYSNQMTANMGAAQMQMQQAGMWMNLGTNLAMSEL